MIWPLAWACVTPDCEGISLRDDEGWLSIDAVAVEGEADTDLGYRAIVTNYDGALGVGLDGRWSEFGEGICAAVKADRTLEVLAALQCVDAERETWAVEYTTVPQGEEVHLTVEVSCLDDDLD